MSAARNMPLTDFASWTITIDATFAPSPKAVVVGYGDSVMFHNNSGVDISIQVTNNAPGQPVGSNLGISNGTTAGFQVPNTDAATNYFVYAGGVQKSGPWAIQVQNGCMYVSITNGYSSPDPVAIPPAGTGSTPGGKLEIYATDQAYDISWTTTDPLSPVITKVNVGVQNNPVMTVKAGMANLPYSYSFHPSMSPTEGQGGGRVKVGS